MADYFSTLTPEQKRNIQFIIKRMNEKGITNKFTQSAILSVASKESAFVPKRETGYSKTSNARIRQIFGSRVQQFDEGGLTALKSNDEAFFNTIYGLPKYGQTATEGFKFRGGGLNQVTFKDAYKKLSAQLSEDKVSYPKGVDLVANPDLINDLQIATDCLILFFKNCFKSAPKGKLAQYNATDINSFTTTKDSVGAIYNANAGWGHTKESLDADPTGGKARAESRVDGFLQMVNAIV